MDAHYDQVTLKWTMTSTLRVFGSIQALYPPCLPSCEKVAPHISACPCGDKNHLKLRATKLDRQAMQIIDVSAACLKMLQLRDTAVSGPGKTGRTDGA